MLAAVDHPLPLPRAHDLDDVRQALGEAHGAWQRDDLEEALRWLKRAAREAAERDQVTRALELSKAAADLALDIDEDTPRRSTVVPSGHALAKGQVPPPPPLPRLMPRPRHASIPPVPQGAARFEEEPIPLARHAAPAEVSLFDDDDDEPTVIRHLQTPQLEDAPTSVGLTASRVAVFVNPERGTLEVAPLESDEPPPPGAPVAMLVAPSTHDAERLAALLRQITVPRR